MPDNKKKNNEWGQLSMKDKAALIDIYVKHGYTSIDEIRKDYESNRDRFINSDANFVQRLRNEDTRSIIDDNGENATHKMSWVTGDNQATIYPSIQESEGRLVNRENEKLGGYYSAAENGDTVNVSKPFAEYYEPRYKRDFQGFFEKFVPQKKTVDDMNEELIYDNRREDSNVLAPGGRLDGDDILDGTQDQYGVDIDWYDLQDKYPLIYKKFRPKKPGFLSIKDMAYNIGVNSQGSAYVDTKDIMGYALNNDKYVPTIYAYIYGPDKVYNRFNSKSNGFDYSNYLKKTGYKNVNEYNGLFNENNEFYINPKNRGLVEELAKNGAHIYSQDYLDSGYHDDVNSYIHKFGFDENGNVVISDSDIYDFYRDFDTTPLHSAEYKLMERIGNPYILRQDNIPVKYDDNYTDSLNYELDNLYDEEIARLTNSGYIEPAVVSNKFGGKANRFDNGGDTKDSILNKAYNWIVGLFGSNEINKNNEKEQTNIIQDIDNRMLEEFRQKNRYDRFERKNHNDSPTRIESESIEDDINYIEKKMFNEATRVRGDFKDYYIPYIEEKEIVVPKVGRVSTNILDSLAINAERAGIPIKEAIGLASIETKFGATPNISTSAWKKGFVEKYKREPTDEEIKKYERECLNASYAKNFGGIYPNFLINNHDWYNYGWEQSNKYKKELGSIKSPLQHGFTIYKMGLYNTGDENHTQKVKEEGERLFKTKPIKLWYEQYKKERKEGKINK